MRHLYSINIIINHEYGEEYATRTAHGIGEAAWCVHEYMAKFKPDATSFVFTIARVGSAAKGDDANA